MQICLMDETGATDGALSVLAARWGLEHDEDNPMALVLTPQHLELRKRDEPKLGGIFVDFVGGALLDDGLTRGYADADIGPWLQQRLQLIHASSLTALTDITPRPQVVYLDPMFPHRQKSALVKKEMRVFQSLVGPDLDADGLLEPARQLATKRVVVKRPDYAPPLADVATPNAIVTKGHRFDIYAGTPLTE
ncbi:class I SAM-dependent methyltransferase [Salmonella enterica]